MPTRILFTGGTGKAGRYLLLWLTNEGYQVLNFDIQPFAHPAIPTLLGDVTNEAQVFNAISTGRPREPARSPPPSMLSFTSRQSRAFCSARITRPSG